jgi:predicted ribosome quality control (RQC) complex YloA/Tae2 family protein
MIHKKIHFEKIGKEIDFYIGENAQENQDIVLYANEDDLWFHLSDYPSPHVLVSTNNISIERKQFRPIIIQASLLCKQYSKYKSEKNIDVIYTKIKNVIPTDKIGSVQTCNVKHIRI